MTEDQIKHMVDRFLSWGTFADGIETAAQEVFEGRSGLSLDERRQVANNIRALADRKTEAKNTAMDDTELREILATVAESNSWMKERSETAKNIRDGKDVPGVSIGSAIEAMRIVLEKANANLTAKP